MKKAYPLIITVLLIASIGINVFNYKQYKNEKASIKQTQQELDDLSAEILDKENRIREIEELQSQTDELLGDKEEELTIAQEECDLLQSDKAEFNNLINELNVTEAELAMSMGMAQAALSAKQASEQITQP